MARGSRITGTQRAELAAQLGQRYAEGVSIRAIAEDIGRSFGFVHGLVKESGVELRSRGGATRGPAARGAAPTAEPSAAASPARDPLTGTGGEKAKAGAGKTKDKVAGKARTEVRAKGKPKGKDKKPGKKGKR